MESRKRLMIVVAVGVVAMLAVVMVRSWLASVPEAPPPVEAPKEVRVLAAVRDLPLGTMVQPLADIDWAAVPPENLKEGLIRDDVSRIEDFAGAVVRKPLRIGDAIDQSALTRAGAGSFMSAVLEPGMRAVSIAVTATSGNAGFISPGDRVDLIVTHRLPVPGQSASDGSIISETFIRDVRVIAVDQQLDNPENKAILAKTVTVEVTPRQAEQIAVAGDLGKISFALRSLVMLAPAEGEPPLAAAPAEGYTRDSDISGALETGGMASTIRIIRGDQVENLTLR